MSIISIMKLQYVSIVLIKSIFKVIQLCVSSRNQYAGF